MLARRRSFRLLAVEETTATVMAGLRAVIELKGLFCSLYSDRGAHFWLTPKSGGKVDYAFRASSRLRRIGRDHMHSQFLHGASYLRRALIATFSCTHDLSITNMCQRDNHLNIESASGRVKIASTPESASGRIGV